MSDAEWKALEFWLSKLPKTSCVVEIGRDVGELRKLGFDPIVVQAELSVVTGEKWAAPIDVLYVDGLLEYVANDCRLYLPHVVSGGVAVFQNSAAVDVATAIDRHVVNGGWKALAFAGGMSTWRKP